jgi:hypothetical protein
LPDYVPPSQSGQQISKGGIHDPALPFYRHLPHYPHFKNHARDLSSVRQHNNFSWGVPWQASASMVLRKPCGLPASIHVISVKLQGLLRTMTDIAAVSANKFEQLLFTCVTVTFTARSMSSASPSATWHISLPVLQQEGVSKVDEKSFLFSLRKPGEREREKYFAHYFEISHAKKE